MSETVEFQANGQTASGHLAVPESGHGPGVIVVQEWWGLTPQLRGVCDRLATEGFVALAPDLYHGELAQHDEVEKAMELVGSLAAADAARDMGAAADYLAGHEAVQGKGIGAIGFCMGGGLTYILAANKPDLIKAIVPFYGVIPWGEDAQPDYSAIEAAIQGHYGEEDDLFPVEYARGLEGNLKDLGKDVEFFYYEGAGHAFTNEQRSDAHHPEAAAQAWERMVGFLHSQLD